MNETSYPNPTCLTLIASKLRGLAEDAEEIACGTLGGMLRQKSKDLTRAVNLIHLAIALNDVVKDDTKLAIMREDTAGCHPVDLETQIWALINGALDNDVKEQSDTNLDDSA